MRGFTVRSVFGCALLSLAVASPALSASTSAPADEYFGRYHLSILGIRNALAGMTLKAHDHPECAGSLMNSAALTEDAIHQWQVKYPNDSWLPKTVFSLERLYVTIGTQESAESAVRTAAWLDHSFPQTAFAQMGHTELASLSTSDDGNLSTPDSPAMLGMIPALSEGAETAAPASANAPAALPSYAYASDVQPPGLQGPHAIDITVHP